MNILEMFSGIGGFRLGLEQAGFNFDWVGFSEIDKYASECYKKHWEESEELGDATNIDVSRLPRIDMLVGGFPCQAFSIAGKRRGFEDIRGTLFFEIARIAKAKRVPIILLENVKGLLSHDNGETFKTIIRTLTELGYCVQWQVLNSKNHGVPQNRERVFIVGHLGKECFRKVFPIGKTNSNIDNEIKKIMNEGGNHSGGGVFDENGICPTLTSGGNGGATNNCPKIIDKKGIEKQKNYASTLTGGGHSGGNHSDMDLLVIPVLTPDRLEKRQNGRRFKEDGEPSFTLTAQDKHGIYNGSRIRRLTPTECERLQGFPESKKTVTMTVCLGHQKKNVNAETKNHKLLKSVGSVEKINIQEVVLSVVKDLDTNIQQTNKPAQQNVLINCEESKIKISSQEKLLLNAKIVENKNLFPHQINIEDFALLSAGLISTLESVIANGKGESQKKETCSILQKNGKKHVKLYGKEIMQLVKIAEKDLTTHKKLLKFITSSHSSTKNLEQRLITLCWYVINAITGYIPKKILNQNTFTLVLDTQLGHTFGFSDTQRYKMLGNAVTVNVIKAIGEELF